MKPSEYITFSQREKIENPKIAEILDYCERYFDFEIIQILNSSFLFIKFKILNKEFFLNGRRISCYDGNDCLLHLHLDIFYSNYVGILGSLRNLK